MAVRVAVAWIGLALAVSAGCSRAPVDEAWIADIAARHGDADRRLDAGDVAGARAALAAVVAETPPAGASEDRRLAVQDTYFRLARLSLADRDAARALAYADAGLALGTGPHVFVANLLVARGAAHEALGDARTAADDYHRALTMNEALLHETLGSGEGPR